MKIIKKILAIILCAAMIFNIIGCGLTNDITQVDVETVNKDVDKTKDNKKKKGNDKIREFKEYTKYNVGDLINLSEIENIIKDDDLNVEIVILNDDVEVPTGDNYIGRGSWYKKFNIEYNKIDIILPMRETGEEVLYNKEGCMFMSPKVNENFYKVVRKGYNNKVIYDDDNGGGTIGVTELALKRSYDNKKKLADLWEIYEKNPETLTMKQMELLYSKDAIEEITVNIDSTNEIYHYMQKKTDNDIDSGRHVYKDLKDFFSTYKDNKELTGKNQDSKPISYSYNEGEYTYPHYKYKIVIDVKDYVDKKDNVEAIQTKEDAVKYLKDELMNGLDMMMLTDSISSEQNIVSVSELKTGKIQLQYIYSANSKVEMLHKELMFALIDKMIEYAEENEQSEINIKESKNELMAKFAEINAERIVDKVWDK